MNEIPRSSGVGASDLTGEKFGRLTVTAFSHVNSQRLRCWKCRCECGGEVTTSGRNLRSGITVSCGCRRRETLSLNRRRCGNVTHGKSKTPEYRCWTSMLARCRNAATISFPHYGARGITVCERWTNSFVAFLQDMGPKPSPAHSIDRINSDGNYEPGNCRWAPPEVQARNKRGVRLVTFRGETICLADWAARVGIKPMALARRLDAGWSVERAMTSPLRGASRGTA